MSWLLGLPSAAFAAPLWVALFQIWPLFRDAPMAGAFVFGALIGAMLAGVLITKVPMLPVLEHELTHLLCAAVLLRKPQAVSASADEGEAVYDGRGTTFIRLGPYVLPTLTLLLSPLLLIVDTSFEAQVVGVLGGTWGYHVATLIHEARPSQPDLRAGGLLGNTLAVAGLGTLCYGATALFAVGRGHLVGAWMLRGVEISATWIQDLVAL